MASIVSDDEVFAQFKEDSRKQYKRMWLQFRDYLPQFDFESGPPGEDSLVNFFKYLRLEKKFASTTLWTWYSCINSMMKRKYNVKLQNLPRLTMLLKGYDTDVKKKAHIFDEDEIKTFMLADMESAYWLVRQAITIVAFFGGLRLQECQDLKLEKIVRTQDGFRIVHTRVKQCIDQRDTAFRQRAGLLTGWPYTWTRFILASTTTAGGCGGPALRAPASKTSPWAVT
jgi:hypothetical protein